MNREIKFRAWDGKEMWFWDDKGFSKGIEDKNNIKEWIDNDRFILMQFVGLLDKNNKEIYEGDIVKCIWSMENYKSIEIVEYSDYDARFNPWLQCDCTTQLESIEIIGNKFENPELLNLIK